MKVTLAAYACPSHLAHFHQMQLEHPHHMLLAASSSNAEALAVGHTWTRNSHSDNVSNVAYNVSVLATHSQ